ncbi:hypothetical protein LYNGBM3L_62650 [Moorena producens 3L]|uniref:Uncharacterized protein n=1 Tax=Moorena producens 3L TaxID=489825 RepID=F4Y0S8_9CYAN|nr:hypothetical protein LYNGBM3L_62650 [Moorena producens 3L]
MCSFSLTPDTVQYNQLSKEELVQLVVEQKKLRLATALTDRKPG